MRVVESIQTTTANKQTTIWLANVFKLKEFIKILLLYGLIQTHCKMYSCCYKCFSMRPGNQITYHKTTKRSEGIKHKIKMHGFTISCLISFSFFVHSCDSIIVLKGKSFQLYFANHPFLWLYELLLICIALYNPK